MESAKPSPSNWLKKAHRFGVLGTITNSDIGLGIGNFGGWLASQTMASDRPRPRAHVLYTSARKAGIGEIRIAAISVPMTRAPRPETTSSRKVMRNPSTNRGRFSMIASTRLLS